MTCNAAKMGIYMLMMVWRTDFFSRMMKWTINQFNSGSCSVSQMLDCTSVHVVVQLWSIVSTFIQRSKFKSFENLKLNLR